MNGGQDLVLRGRRVPSCTERAQGGELCSLRRGDYWLGSVRTACQKELGIRGSGSLEGL